MNYAAQQRDPRKHLIGIFLVVGFHVVLGYALVNGLARKVVDVFKKPLTVNVIEEIKSLPPPPPPKALPPPKLVATPPPAYVPPVEVAVQAPPQAVITTTQKPTPEPVVVAPAAPAPINVAVACPNHRSVNVDMPRQAQRLGLSGEVLVGFTVSASGEVKDISILRSSNAMFNNAALNAVAQYRCVGQGHDARVQVPFAFRIEG